MPEPRMMTVRVCATYYHHTLISTRGVTVRACSDCIVTEYVSAAWLVSDEAVERVAGALAGPAPCHCSDDPRHTLGSVRCPQHGQGEWPRDRHRTAARAVLAALRGDGDV